jgi:hypothetical protein
MLPDTPCVLFHVNATEPTFTKPCMAAVFHPYGIPKADAGLLFADAMKLHEGCPYTGGSEVGSNTRGKDAKLASIGFNFAAVRQGQVWTYYHDTKGLDEQATMFAEAEEFVRKVTRHIR